ncbi:hypothetical protein K402DRAFT_459973 [Aulographum hederae CBS 113979]|uniref:Uncharacterized protein n=1 Tax=Aulographum hederae CBS 113979 TaxID=1176131 RepID=A0A6G1HDH0_9PEZI|nr:hypothetical protein K402DRAFT_459973 [Aulographum hederae CBS 113979]
MADTIQNMRDILDEITLDTFTLSCLVFLATSITVFDVYFFLLAVYDSPWLLVLAISCCINLYVVLIVCWFFAVPRDLPSLPLVTFLEARRRASYLHALIVRFYFLAAPDLAPETPASESAPAPAPDLAPEAPASESASASNSNSTSDSDADSEADAFARLEPLQAWNDACAAFLPICTSLPTNMLASFPTPPVLNDHCTSTTCRAAGPCTPFCTRNLRSIFESLELLWLKLHMEMWRRDRFGMWEGEEQQVERERALVLGKVERVNRALWLLVEEAKENTREEGMGLWEEG